ncbi:MAG: nuclear transport factor 2 family protein [Chitinophagaceae bacterium]|mgnify:FL=1|nr:nuclear transport factor 2 family protein [Chitinophagaceae bacterium]MBK8310173.1 nuclear transport factor 2 family protein [Chitinophagaceae bacterium]MBK8607010.1 nuclear transport factor 2 family protein [Chitinophagaceae bacterium]MBP6476984.1 nuclear transport factor 2 family protein [Chitinophagaceae bacterium]MBP7107882.1 nuclear transport factor 2 family protein [Chitinophagaceae bacterium]
MKKTFLFLLIFSFGVITNAQSKKETAVANAIEKLRIAMVDGVKEKLEAVVADKLSYGHSGGHIEGKVEFVEKIVSGKSDFVSIDLTEQTINISGKTAIVRHILTAKTNDNGKPGQVHLRILLIFQKDGGSWKLLARQAVKIA